MAMQNFKISDAICVCEQISGHALHMAHALSYSQPSALFGYPLVTKRDDKNYDGMVLNFRGMVYVALLNMSYKPKDIQLIMADDRRMARLGDLARRIMDNEEVPEYAVLKDAQ